MHHRSVATTLAFLALSACAHQAAQADIAPPAAAASAAPVINGVSGSPPVTVPPPASSAPRPVGALPKAAPDPLPARVPDPLKPKKNEPEAFDGFRNQAALAQLPKAPVLIKGCENNCCSQLKSRKVAGEIDLYEKPGDDSKEVRTLKAGEGLKAATAYMRVRKYGTGTFGAVAARGANADLKKGEAFAIIRYVGDSKLLIWAKGRVRLVSDENPDVLQYKIAQEANVESWVKITAADGTQGWALGPDLDWGPCQSAGL